MRTALANFVGSLDRVRDITVELDANLSKALSDKRMQQRHETVECASTVILSGYFESFLADVAEAFVGELCSRAIPFDDLPLKIRATHFSEGAEFLAKRARRESTKLKRDTAMKHRLIDSEEIARRIASVAVGSPYELVWEAFADTRANPGPETLKQFLNRFDVESGWKSLSAGVGLSEATLEATLTSFILIRNECAHSGTATKIPTPSDIRDYCDLLQKVASEIIAILEAHLVSGAFT
jgi:hypothetical protein